MTIKWVIWVLGCCLQGGLLFGQSEGEFMPDRPGVADTPYPAEKGRIHLEAGLDWFEANSQREYHLPLLWVRFGLTKWLELRLADQAVMGTGERSKSNFGIDSPIIGLKARLWQNEHAAIALMGHTSVQREGSTRFLQSDVGLTAMHEWGGWSLNEHVWLAGAKGILVTNWAVCLGRSWGNFGPFVEYFGARDQGGASSGLDGGVAWQVAPNTVLDASAGYLCGQRWRNQGWFASLGISLRLANFAAQHGMGQKPESTAINAPYPKGERALKPSFQCPQIPLEQGLAQVGA